MVLDWAAISGLAAAISAVAAAIAATLSLRAMQEAKAIAAEQRANDYFKRYLELAIEYPKLSTDEDGDKEEQEQQQYEWFVSFTLMMAREVLIAHPKDENWRAMVFEQLKYNKTELNRWKKKYPRVLRSLGPDIEKLIDDVLLEKKLR